jgi:hypothetical protein
MWHCEIGVKVYDIVEIKLKGLEPQMDQIVRKIDWENNFVSKGNFGAEIF